MGRAGLVQARIRLEPPPIGCERRRGYHRPDGDQRAEHGWHHW